MHITASVFINDDEPGLHLDFEEWLEDGGPARLARKYENAVNGEAALSGLGDTTIQRSARG